MRAQQFTVAVVCVVLALGNAQAGTTYTYDDLGRLTVAAYDNGKEIDYSYDQAGNRSSVVIRTTPPAHANALTAPKKKKTPPARHH